MPEEVHNCGGTNTALSIWSNIMSGINTTIPEIDLNGDLFKIPDEDIYADISKVTNEDITTKQLNGNGTFDVLLSTTSLHLREEYESNRISGAEYSKVYTALVQACMTNAVQFVLQKDQAYWQAVNARTQAKLAEVQIVNARVSIELAKIEVVAARFKAMTQQAEYALTKFKLATEEATFCNLLAEEANKKASTEQIIYTTNSLMPVQRSGYLLDNELKTYNLEEMLPIEKQFSEKKVLKIQGEINLDNYNLTQIMPIQKTTLITENLIKEFSLTKLMPLEEEFNEKKIIKLQGEISVDNYNLANILPLQKSGLEVDIGIKEYQLDSVLPKELEYTEKKIDKIVSETDTVLYNLTDILPQQKLGLVEDVTSKTYNRVNVLPKQLEKITAEVDVLEKQIEIASAQIILTEEQVEVQRAQTSNKRTDNVTPIVGVLGAQRELYIQQKQAFIEDSRVKVSDQIMKGWITIMTALGSEEVPNGLAKHSIEQVLNKLRENIDLGAATDTP